MVFNPAPVILLRSYITGTFYCQLIICISLTILTSTTALGSTTIKYYLYINCRRTSRKLVETRPLSSTWLNAQIPDATGLKCGNQVIGLITVCIVYSSRRCLRFLQYCWRAGYLTDYYSRRCRCHSFTPLIRFCFSNQGCKIIPSVTSCTFPLFTPLSSMLRIVHLT